MEKKDFIMSNRSQFPIGRGGFSCIYKKSEYGRPIAVKVQFYANS
jgi:hypothetical protein